MRRHRFFASFGRTGGAAIHLPCRLCCSGLAVPSPHLKESHIGLKGSKTEQSLKDAFAVESQANRRYLYFANKADTDGQNRHPQR